MILKSNGDVFLIEPENINIPYKLLKKSIGGGWMAFHSTTLDGIGLYCDDQGHRKGLPLNKNATRLYNSFGNQHPVVGDICLCKPVSGDSMTLSYSDYETVMKMIQHECLFREGNVYILKLGDIEEHTQVEDTKCTIKEFINLT